MKEEEKYKKWMIGGSVLLGVFVVVVIVIMLYRHGKRIRMGGAYGTPGIDLWVGERRAGKSMTLEEFQRTPTYERFQRIFQTPTT